MSTTPPQSAPATRADLEKMQETLLEKMQEVIQDGIADLKTDINQLDAKVERIDAKTDRIEKGLIAVLELQKKMLERAGVHA